jgi:putative aminopeptidase FrvX
MEAARVQFLRQLLSTPGPSGDEVAAARVWRAEARTFADSVSADVAGNSFAALEGPGPRVLLAGHIDEIGLMVTYIDEGGYLYFAAIGGWDAQVLVGQRVRLLGHNGEVLGLIGKKPIHLIKPDDRGKVSQIDSLWIDIGASSGEEAAERVHAGCTAVIDAPLVELPNGRIAGRSIDNRVGAFVVLEALRLLSEGRPQASVAAVATVQEEIGLSGAMVAAFSFDPQVAIAVDVTFATDHPQSDKQQHGDVKLGGGPVLSRGSANSPLVFRRLVEVADRAQIPYSLQMTPRYTGTDADAIYKARGGIASAVVSIPNRYMHSPNEMVALDDLDAAARLIAAFVRSIERDGEFIAE